MVRGLLEQLGHELRRAVGLRQGGDAGLAQDLVFRHGRGRRGVVGGLDRVLRRNDVLLLGADYGADRVEGVDLGADVTVLGSYGGDSRIQRSQNPFSTTLAEQIA